MHELESFLENEIHEILLDLEIQMGHLIPARRQYLVKKRRKTGKCCPVDFAVVADH